MLWKSREDKVSVRYSQKFIAELIKQGEEALIFAQRELISFEVNATPQTQTKGE
jgi:hypothetical protein